MRNNGVAQRTTTHPVGTMPAMYDMLERVSRTFALSNRCLPRRFRRAMTIAYLLLRVSDFLEDNHLLPPPQKRDLLRLWDRILAGVARKRQLLRELREVPIEDDDAEGEVATRFPEILRRLALLPGPQHRVVVDRVRESTRGMALWQERGSPDKPGSVFECEADLDDYMHYVAGIVGYMITEVFSEVSVLISVRRRTLMPLGREYGLGLQTVNVIRGLHKDHARGWVFVPQSFCEAEDLSPEQLFDPAYLPRSLRVVHRLIAKAERHLLAGLSFVMKMPRSMHRVRLATMWPLLFAARTLAISRNNPQVLLGEAKISRREVKAIIRHTTALGWSNTWLHHYYRSILEDPPAA
ncbi:MAG: squalene/phytoene synthase family protein [Spirochaetota bacterium]